MPKKTFERLDEGKKRRIENSALSVINAQGYDRTTIRDVVRAANIPRGSFYQYFDGMEDLFNHLINVISEQKMAYMNDLWEKVEKQSFIGLYPDFIKRGVAFAYQHKEAYLFGYHLYHSNSEEVWRLRREIEREGISMMETLLDKDKDQGILKRGVETHLLAVLLFDFNANQLVRMVYDQVDEKTIMKKVEAFLAIVCHGIMVEEELYEKESL